MADKATRTRRRKRILALLTGIKHLSGSFLPDKYYRLVRIAEKAGLLEVRMMNGYQDSSRLQSVLKGRPFMLVTNGGIGFGHFTLAVMLTDKGRASAEKLEAGVIA